MTPTVLEYPAGDVTCRGEVYQPDNASGPLPVVLVVHAWDGLGDEVRSKAIRLATEAGCIAFAIDIYGGGKFWEDASQLMEALTPYLEDRALLTARMEAAAAAARSLPNADPTRLGAMGYCFGGTAVLDLARAGTEGVRGVVSFHGGLEGHDLPGPDAMAASVLVLHGEDDPMVPPELVATFKAEMNRRKADWQLHAYGHTVHAFTRPGANNPDFGTVYNASADRRSWQAMRNFFDEVL
jgi:dienelactone hydrolase